jgi:hypothetical protein
MTIRRSALLVVGLAITVEAAPKARATWADWVGDYEGKLAWKGCLTPGAARARISLDAVDGAMFIELVEAGGGLRAMSLVEEEAGWSAQSGDVKLRVTRPRANAVYVDAEVGSDCRLRANLARATTKIEACDRLIGWTRIESQCTKQVADRLEDPAKLATERKRWKPGADGMTRMCETRSNKLVASLLMARCAPDPDPDAFIMGPACQALEQAMGTLRRCPNLPPQAMQALDAMVSGPRSAHDATTRAIVEERCGSLRRSLDRVATDSRCPL